MLLNDQQYLLEEINKLLKEETHIKIMYVFFYCVKHFDTTPAQPILVYTIPAQVSRLTTLSIDFSIQLPTKWYIVTLVPRGCNNKKLRV